MNCCSVRAKQPINLFELLTYLQFATRYCGHADIVGDSDVTATASTEMRGHFSNLRRECTQIACLKSMRDARFPGTEMPDYRAVLIVRPEGFGLKS